ncbi:MAG: hypothetical protein IPL21_16145 [Saprospirales bacterium]|nr:hypothetical protein [Saprospirales bacterium]
MQLTAQEKWKLEKDKDGIKVWTRKIENTKLKESKVTGIVNANIEKVIDLLRDYKNHEKISYKVDIGSGKLVKKVSDNEFYTYITASAPLIKRRDLITHFTIKPDASGAYYIVAEAAPKLMPENENNVRIHKMKATWKISPISENKTEIIEQAFTDPAGTIPDLLVNISSVDAPFYMMTKMRELVK